MRNVQMSSGILGPSGPDFSAPRPYVARDPEACPLVRLLRDHLDDFIARCDDDQRPLPRFVQRQLRAITTCGNLGHGFLRLECSRCRGPRVVPRACRPVPAKGAALSVVRWPSDE